MTASDATVMGDRLARALFRALRDRPVADRQLVLRALADLDERVPLKKDLGVQSLKKCMEEDGRPPSRRSYDEWRRRQPRPQDWLSSTAIRDACGGWTKAVGFAGAKGAPDVLARRLSSRGREFTRDDLKRALTLFAADVPETERTARRYREWSHGAVKRGDGIPLHTRVFVLRFGSFSQALAAAAIPAVRTRGLPANAIRDEDVERTVALAIDDLGNASITTGQYRRWREERIAEEVPWAVPSVERIYLQFPSWRSAISAGYRLSLLGQDRANA